MNFWAAYPDIEKELEKVENYMRKAVISRNKELTEIATDLINAGGKRIRPAFVILSAKAGRMYKEKVIIPLAASIELIHTATLVHDDIIDEAQYRRGKKSVQSKWGKDMAIYVGDYLLSKSFLMLSEDTSFNRINYVAKYIKSICEGEINQYQQRYVKEPIFAYLKTIYRKTAILFGMSLGAGANESKASKKNLNALSAFGTYYGLAFQIYDDLLDYTSSQSLIGKPVGNDLKQGYYTLPLLYALENPTYGPQIQSLLNKKEDMTEKEMDNVLKLVNQSDGIEASKILLNKCVDKAIATLEPLRNKEVKNVLEDLVRQLIA